MLSVSPSLVRPLGYGAPGHVSICNVLAAVPTCNLTGCVQVFPLHHMIGLLVSQDDPTLASSNVMTGHHIRSNTYDMANKKILMHIYDMALLSVINKHAPKS